MESLAGRPDILFFLPEANDARNYLKPVCIKDIEIAEERCCKQPPPNGCDDNFTELAIILMEENNLTMPTTPDEANVLYSVLIQEIESL